MYNCINNHDVIYILLLSIIYKKIFMVVYTFCNYVQFLKKIEVSYDDFTKILTFWSVT